MSEPPPKRKRPNPPSAGSGEGADGGGGDGGSDEGSDEEIERMKPPTGSESCSEPGSNSDSHSIEEEQPRTASSKRERSPPIDPVWVQVGEYSTEDAYNTLLYNECTSVGSLKGGEPKTIAAASKVLKGGSVVKTIRKCAMFCRSGCLGRWMKVKKTDALGSTYGLLRASALPHNDHDQLPGVRGAPAELVNLVSASDWREKSIRNILKYLREERAVSLTTTKVKQLSSYKAAQKRKAVGTAIAAV
ncbi:hypothetical protein T492DRAFT_958612 [Pavlovales sp. CCMP2436]|nr:hypothetical protein T492DRAFT_958612 [Pavlovales sp. CCMP2436]